MRFPAFEFAAKPIVAAVIAALGLTSLAMVASPAGAISPDQIWEKDQPRTKEEQGYLDRLKRKAERLRTFVDNSPKQRALERRLKDLDARNAVKALKDNFAEILKANETLVDTLPKGSRITGYTGLYSARVRVKGKEKPRWLISSAPLRATKGGRLKPVDLTPKLKNSTFELGNGLIDLDLPKSIGEGFSVGVDSESLVQLMPLDQDSDAEAKRIKKSLFYANAFEDTDVLLQPTTLGLRMALQIRSKNAPPTYRFRLELDRGQVAEIVQGGLIVKEGDGSLLQVDPPAARDRHGRPLKASFSLKDDILAIAVDHRERNYAYPALLESKIAPQGGEAPGGKESSDGEEANDGKGSPRGGGGPGGGRGGRDEEVDTCVDDLAWPDIENPEWDVCYGFDVDGKAGWYYVPHPAGDRPPSETPYYQNGLFDNCYHLTDDGHGTEYHFTGLCIATKTADGGGPNTYWGGSYGEFGLAAPAWPETYFDRVRFGGHYQERQREGDWPEQCARVALYPSRESETVWDTGWQSSGSYPIDNVRLEPGAGAPNPGWAVFRLHSCAGLGSSEDLWDWDAWGRIEVVEAILVDQTPPTNVVASGSLWDARSTAASPTTKWYGPQGHRIWTLTVAADDVGSGMGEVGLTSVILQESKDVDCDYSHESGGIQPCGTHNQGSWEFYEDGYEVDDESHDVHDPDIDHTSEVDHGPNEICAYALDYAGNESDPALCWNVFFDLGIDESTVGVDAEEGHARAYWTPVVDTDGGPEEDPGSGLDHYEYRHRISDGDWTGWTQTNETESPLLEDLPQGAEVTFQVRSVDQVGNYSEVSEAKAKASEQPVLGKRAFQTYATGGEGFFEDLTTNLKEGSLLSQRRDMEIPSLGPDFKLTRTYNSRKNTRGGILGYGWHSSLETYLLELPDQSVLYDDGQGSIFRFNPQEGGPGPCVDKAIFGVGGEAYSPGGSIASRGGGARIAAGPDARIPIESIGALRRPCISTGAAQGSGYEPIPGLHLTLDKEGDGFTLTDQDQNVQRFDSEGKLQSLTDRNGNTLAYTYDQTGQLNLITDAAGRQTSIAYDVHGRLSSVTDPLGRTTRYGYTSDHILRWVEDPEGKKTCYAYDQDLRLTRTATPKLVASNGCASITDQDSGQREGEAVVRYDSEGRVISLTNERHRGGGNQVSIGGVPIGASTTYHWAEEPGCEVAPCVKSPVRAITSYELNAAGQIARLRDPGGREYTRAYDEDLNPTEIVSDAETGGRQSRTLMTWDDQGHLLSRKEPGHSQPTIYAYLNGDLVQKTLPSGRVTTYAYDQDHNLTQKTLAPGTPDEATTTYAYDGQGNLIQVTDPEQKTTAYSYDSNGNRAQVFEPESPVPAMTLTHDGQGNVTSSTDAVGNQSIFTRSPTGKLQSQQDTRSGAGGPTHTAALGWGELGELLSQADQGQDPDGQETRSSQTTTFEENAKPTDSTFGVSQQGDPATDSEVDLTLGGSGSATNRAQRDGQGSPLGHAYEFSFYFEDTLWIAARSSTDDYVGVYEYDTDDNVLEVDRHESDSVIQSSTHDQANREVSRNFTSLRDPLNPVVDQTYAYDQDDRLIQVTDETAPEGSATYAYDAQGRLIQETIDGEVMTYGYDLSGNRTSMVKGADIYTYAYDARGRLTQIQTPQGTRLLTCDDLGNLIQSQDELGQVTTYEWDARSRLARVTKPDGQRIDFTYQDVTNLRTTKQVRDPAGTLTSSIEYQYDSATGLLASEVELSSGEPETKLAYNYDAFGRPISVTVGSDIDPPTYYYDLSPRGDVLALNNKWGSTATGGTFRYDAFGNHVLRTGSLYNPIRWRGAYYDEETGLYYLKNRYYDPTLGRYISPDPARAAYPMTQRYAYAENDPVNLVQPQGSKAGEEAFDPNPFERRLARIGIPKGSLDTLRTKEMLSPACDTPAHYWGRPAPKERVLVVGSTSGDLLVSSDRGHDGPCLPAH